MMASIAALARGGLFMWDKVPECSVNGPVPLTTTRGVKVVAALNPYLDRA
nr:MAG TPA: hypothetical protein [Caudoviricetes sp.]